MWTEANHEKGKLNSLEFFIFYAGEGHGKCLKL